MRPIAQTSGTYCLAGQAKTCVPVRSPSQTIPPPMLYSGKRKPRRCANIPRRDTPALEAVMPGKCTVVCATCRTPFRVSPSRLRYARYCSRACQTTPKQSVEDRFWACVTRSSDPSSCWEWQGYVTVHGYGSLGIRQRPTPAHRLSYEFHYGPIPPGLHVLHHCDNPRCVNPAHLFLGTHTDNMRDMKAKGRAATGEQHGSHLHPDRTRRGRRHGLAKLNEEAVRYIRASHPLGLHSYSALARKYDVSIRSIEHVIKKTSWKHVS